MKRYLLAAVLLSCWMSVAGGGDKTGHADGDKGHLMVRPDTIKWGPAPPALPSGAQFAVLIGDPTKMGPYTIRAKMPDGYQVPAHWHPSDENVTVLKGTLMVGRGDRLDPSKAEA